MRALTRVLAVATLSVAAFGGVPAAQAAPPCYDEPCYVCVRYPCYPQDYPPYLLEVVCEATSAVCVR